MKKTVDGASLVSIKRLLNSVNGSPRYSVILDTWKNGTLQAVTVSDTPTAYAIAESWAGRDVAIMYHVTKGGRVMIDRMGLIKE